MIPEDQRSVNHDPNVQPYCRNSDPITSEMAAKNRSKKIKDIHLFVLRHHLEHQDSDRNAGIAAVKAGKTFDTEEGRRASRTIREDWEWIQVDLGPDGKPNLVQNYGSNQMARRNRITEEGSAVLMSITPEL